MLLGLLARLALGSFLAPTAFPFMTFFPAVVAAAWLGGLLPGLLALVFATLVASWFFIEPVGSLSIVHDYDQAATMAFVLASGFVIAAFELAHRRGAKLVEANDLQATTLASIGDGVLVTDIHGRVQSLNPEAERLTGWTSCQARG